MNVQTVAQPGKQLSVMDQFRRDLGRMEGQFSNALPAHIPTERFVRVVMTAVQNNPKLLKCTRQSLFNACMRAAQDGLLPDGREGAIVPFGDNEDGRKAADTASWMPMIYGIRKKARNSGEIADWFCENVYEGDEFEYVMGDDPHIYHKPKLVGGVERKIIATYSICKFKDGTLSREVMSIAQVEDIRKNYSRAKKGPWSDPVSYPEMVRKTVARRHSKSLPMSTDLDTVMRRDDELYNFEGARERGEKAQAAGQIARPSNAAAALEHFANEAELPTAEAGEAETSNQSQDSGGQPDDPRDGDGTVIEHDAQTGEVREQEAQANPLADMEQLMRLAEKSKPGTVALFETLAGGIISAAAETGLPAAGEALMKWWQSAAARTLRNSAGMTSDDTARVYLEVKATCDDLKAGPK